MKQHAELENEEELLSKGKALSISEGKTAYQWFCKQWANLLQRLLMAHLIYLGGGQRCQVYAGMLLSNVSWISQGMKLYVPSEKIPRLNTSQLPLPPQLYTSIEFFIQRVRPHLFHDPEDAKLSYASLWVNLHGGAAEPWHLTQYVWQAFNEFNKGLDLTPLDFRRRTVIGLWAS